MTTQPHRTSGSRGAQQPVAAHAPQRTKAPLRFSRRPAFVAVVQAADLILHPRAGPSSPFDSCGLAGPAGGAGSGETPAMTSRKKTGGSANNREANFRRNGGQRRRWAVQAE